MIRVENVTYRVGTSNTRQNSGTALVKDLSFTLRPGECTGLIGANGSGKTTLIRLLSGWLRPSNGNIFLEEKKLEAWKARERAQRLALVAQDIPYDVPFSVREIIELGRYPHETNDRSLCRDSRALVDDLLRYVGLTDKAELPFSVLSGGEKQRALFARSLAQEAQVYLLDEASASMDMGQEKRLFGMVRELSREGKTVLAAVHNLNTACEYCDRLLLMYQGHIIADGRPDEVVTNDNLFRAFGVRVHIERNRTSASLMVHHIPEQSPGKDLRVHIIGGGGSAQNTTRLLHSLGYQLTGGVAHGLDNDSALWQSLGLAYVSVQPFVPIDDESFSRAAEMVGKAQLCILCDFPFGPGNLRNLELIRHAHKVLVLEAEPHTQGSRAFYGEARETDFAELCRQLEKEGRLEHISWQDFADRAFHSELCKADVDTTTKIEQ